MSIVNSPTVLCAPAPTPTTTPTPPPSTTLGYPFPSVLDPVQVPPTYYPIEVVQFWRGEYTRGRPLPLHWSILVRTSPKRGNTHEIVGDTDTYATQDRFDVSVQEDGDWRGSHVVGYVSQDGMERVLNAVALVPVVRHRLSWNCQNWVWEALQAVRRLSVDAWEEDEEEEEEEEVYVDRHVTTLELLQTQMMCLLDAWEMGDI